MGALQMQKQMLFKWLYKPHPDILTPILTTIRVEKENPHLKKTKKKWKYNLGSSRLSYQESSEERSEDLFFNAAISLSCSFFRYRWAVALTILTKKFISMIQTTAFQTEAREKSHFFTW